MSLVFHQVMSFVYFKFMSLRFENLESAVRKSQGHLEDVSEDPNLAAVYVPRRVQLSSTSSVISTRQPGILTTTSASLCYHLPRVYHLDTRTGYEPRFPSGYELRLFQVYESQV